jgi:hypothetical protein
MSSIIIVAAIQMGEYEDIHFLWHLKVPPRPMSTTARTESPPPLLPLPLQESTTHELQPKVQCMSDARRLGKTSRWWQSSSS